jgi:hypothetical protein
MSRSFHTTYHDGSMSYSPQEFFNCRDGDCKDYAVFASYVLAYHNHYAEIITFTWYDRDGQRNGHVVAIFQDKDGKLKYMSNGRIMAEVKSVADLLEKEKDRLEAVRIGGYLVLPPGTTAVRSP